MTPDAIRSLPQRIAAAPRSRKAGTWYLAESATKYPYTARFGIRQADGAQSYCPDKPAYAGFRYHGIT